MKSEAGARGSRAAMLQWARSWAGSGISRAEYAARAGVSKHTLDYYRSRRCAAARAGLVELEVTGPAAGPPPAGALALVLDKRQAIPWSGSGGADREAAQAAGVRLGRVAWGRSARPGSTSAR